MKEISTFEHTDIRPINDIDPNKIKVSDYKPEPRESVRSVEVPSELYSSDKVKSITLEYYKSQSVISELPPADKNNKETRQFVDIKIHRAADGPYSETVRVVTVELDIVAGQRSEIDNIFQTINDPTLKFVLFKDLKPELNEEAQRRVKAKDLSKFIASNIYWKKY